MVTRTDQPGSGGRDPRAECAWVTTHSRHHRVRLATTSLALVGLAAAGLALNSPSQAATATYDSVVLADRPVAFYAGSSGTIDASPYGRHASGVYGGTASTVLLPNGQRARTYNGTSQYLSVPSSPAFSVPTTKRLTWEAWIRPSTLQFPVSPKGYVAFMGKCASYSPSCEWEARTYNLVNSQNRASRISAYIFKPTAGLGSAADWQPAAGTIRAYRWIHVVAQYQTVTTPSVCNPAYPGTINIWVDGIKQNFAKHAPTGCMSQYSVIPKAGTSPLLIGTMAKGDFFAGAIGKVAIYNRLLTQTEINEHFTAMTGRTPSGTCASTCTLNVQP